MRILIVLGLALALSLPALAQSLNTISPNIVAVPSSMQACITDADCMTVQVSCGNQCQFDSVARSSALLFQETYHNGCGAGPIKQCPPPNAASACVDKKCKPPEFTGGRIE